MNMNKIIPKNGFMGVGRISKLKDGKKYLKFLFDFIDINRDHLHIGTLQNGVSSVDRLDTIKHEIKKLRTSLTQPTTLDDCLNVDAIRKNLTIALHINNWLLSDIKYHMDKCAECLSKQISTDTLPELIVATNNDIRQN